MEVSWLLVQQIASMVLMGLAGYGVGKLKLITGEQSRVLSCMCIYLAVPCSLMTSFNTAMEADKLTGLLLALGSAAPPALPGAQWLDEPERARTCPGGAGVRDLQQCRQPDPAHGNGHSGAVVCDLHQRLYPGAEHPDVDPWPEADGGAQQFDWKKIVTTPAIAAILAGLALFITGLRLPGPLVTAMEGLGSCMAPLSMLVIGILFSELDLKRVLCQGRIYWVAGLRLLVYPLLSMAVLLALRVLWPHSDGDNVLLVSLLCAIGPAASAITQMAQLYHNPNSGYVSSINVLTTLLCAVTMPVMVLLFQLGLDLL